MPPWGMEKHTVIKHITTSAKKCMTAHSTWEKDMHSGPGLPPNEQ